MLKKKYLVHHRYPKAESIGVADGLDVGCRGKRGFKDDSKIFTLSRPWPGSSVD